MCNLRWANERGLTLKAKPKIKFKYLHIYFLIYLPTYLPSFLPTYVPTYSPTYINTYLNIDLNVFWPKFNLHAKWQFFNCAMWHDLSPSKIDDENSICNFKT